jgi:hypothetical protein
MDAVARHRLNFDGYKLHLIDGESLVRSWDAVAGTAASPSTKYQVDGDKRPIPAGPWSFSMADIQIVAAKDDAFGTAMKLLYNLSGGNPLFKHGAWFGGSADWGLERVFLVPSAGADPLNHDDVSIHGGDTYGSTGGIDLGHNEVDFFRTLADKGIGSITLDVSYAQDPRPSPHPLAGQFLGSGPGSRGLSPTDHLGKPISTPRAGAATLATSAGQFIDLFGHPFNGSPDDVSQLAGAIADGRLQPAAGYVDASGSDRYSAPFFTESGDKIVISADPSSWCASIVRNGEIERIIQYYKYTFRFRQLPA